MNAFVTELSVADRTRVVHLLLDRIREVDLSLVGLEIAESAELESLVPGQGRLRQVVRDVLRELGRPERSFDATDVGTLGQLADRLVLP